MKTGDLAHRMRIYVSSTDKFGHAPLYEVIVYAAKRYGLAGATVTRGVMGYGASSPVSSQRLWEITEKLPIIIDIVDNPEKIEKFALTIQPYFEKIKNGCLITIEPVNVAFVKEGTKSNWRVF
jgi:uncharacterized protein